MAEFVSGFPIERGKTFALIYIVFIMWRLDSAPPNPQMNILQHFPKTTYMTVIRICVVNVRVEEV